MPEPQKGPLHDGYHFGLVAYRVKNRRVSLNRCIVGNDFGVVLVSCFATGIKKADYHRLEIALSRETVARIREAAYLILGESECAMPVYAETECEQQGKAKSWGTKNLQGAISADWRRSHA